MPSCCYGDEYGAIFSDASARRTARRFARKGLSGSARLLADRVTATGIRDASVLEVGGGIGDIHVELLRRGAATATNIELSPGWESAAAEMLAAAGLRDRVDRRIGDVVDAADELGEADVVLLHRVLCCYPDWPAMVRAATARARRTVGLTIPMDGWWTRLGIRAANAAVALRGRAFRAYVHPPTAVLSTLRADGLEVVSDDRGVLWRTIVARRPSAAR